MQRHALRTRGITITDPPLADLIDPVSAAELRDAMHAILDPWAAGIAADPSPIKERGYQSYVVLTMCRILYTLEHGDVVSKRTAADWAVTTFGEPWAGLINGAWEGRARPKQPASHEDVEKTRALIRFVIAQAR